MSYLGTKNFNHNTSPKIGVLLVNLGTPDAPTKVAVKRYLKEFLSDPRVVEIPRPIWWIILNLIILNIRPKKSAKLYESIWLKEGSPLLHYSQTLTKKVEANINASMGERADNLIIKCAMRYGNPGIPQVLEEMRQANLKYLYVLPLYPHYSAATTGSIFDAISDSVRRWRYTPELHFLQSYHDNDAFIELCCKQIEAYWEKNGKPEKLFLSYHGLPLRCLHSGDPYHCQCHKTTRLIQEKLGVDDNIVQTVFQSRFGRETWLQPYLDSTLESSAKKGLKNVQVFCPGFSVDCLETLEEIAIQGKESFIESGGETFNYIPALNDNEDHATMLKGLMAPVIELWMKQLPDQRLLERQTKLATNQVENQL